MKKTLIGTALAAMTLSTAAPALADPPMWAPAHGRRAHYDRDYDSYGRYREPRALERDEHIWRGRDGRYYCRRGNGTTGLIVGGAVGALIGHEVAGEGDHTVGTIIGAAGGALLGRAIDRGELRCK